MYIFELYFEKYILMKILMYLGNFLISMHQSEIYIEILFLLLCSARLIADPAFSRVAYVQRGVCKFRHYKI